jgi:hypothetical protein
MHNHLTTVALVLFTTGLAIPCSHAQEKEHGDKNAGIEVVVINEDGDREPAREMDKARQREEMERRMRENRERMERMRRKQMERNMEAGNRLKGAGGRGNEWAEPEPLEQKLSLQFVLIPELPGVPPVTILAHERNFETSMELGEEGRGTISMDIRGAVYEMDDGATMLRYSARIEMQGEGNVAKATAASTVAIRPGVQQEVASVGMHRLAVTATAVE